MAITNHERVGKSLELVRDGIKPSLEKTWEGLYGAAWVEKVNHMDRFPDRSPSPDDLAFLLKGIGSTWANVFRDIFGPGRTGLGGRVAGSSKQMGAQRAIQHRRRLPRNGHVGTSAPIVLGPRSGFRSSANEE